MNKQSLQAYQEKILSLIKFCGEKDSLKIHEIETKGSQPLSENNQHVVIPFKKIK